MGENFQVLIDLIIQKAKARTELQKELKELQKDAQIEADVKVNLSDVKKAVKEVEQANKEQQQGSRENIKARAQELAHERMLAKEIKAKADMENAQNKLSKVQTAEKINALKQERQLLTENRKLENEKNKQSSTQNKLNNIQLKIDTGEYDSKVTDLRSKLEQFGSANDTARSDVEHLNTAYKKFADAKDGSEKIEAAKQLDIAIKTATNSYRKINSEYAKTSEIDGLAQKYQVFYDKNTAAHGKWGATLKAGIAELSSGAPVTLQRLQQLEAELLNIGNAARQSGKLGLSFFDKLKQGMSTFSQWTSATAIVSKGIQLGKEGIQFVRELDDALTDVVYTSDITKSQLENLGNSSVKMAKDLKASTADVLEAVKIYSTANATADDILRKSKPAIMLSNVSGMSGSESAKTIQTSLNQFELEDTEEGLLDIVDTLEYVSSQLNYDFTEGMKEITEGIEAAGSVAKNAGLDMQEYATMVGVAVEKTGQKNCPCM